MQRIRSTVVAVVGERADDVAGALGTRGNVRAVLPEGNEPLQRAVDAWREAARSSRTYVVHDADPLASVAEGWVALFDGTGVPGDLEAAVAGVLARWRAGTLELPDFYLVLAAEELAPTWRHWFLGVLRAAAPNRVVPVPGRVADAEHALTRLPGGRWWPDLPRLLDGIDRVAPDALAPPDPPSGPALA